MNILIQLDSNCFPKKTATPLTSHILYPFNYQDRYYPLNPIDLKYGSSESRQGVQVKRLFISLENIKETSSLPSPRGKLKIFNIFRFCKHHLLQLSVF